MMSCCKPKAKPENSSMDINNKDCISLTDDDNFSSTEGIYGYFVIVASFMALFIGTGLSKSCGILVDPISETFETTSSVTLWLYSVILATPSLFSPISSIITDLYGCRKTTMFGAFLAAFGCFTGSFAHNFATLLFLFGIISALGLSLVCIPCIVIVAYYFQKRIGLISGIIMAGGGVGQFVFPPLLNQLISHFTWRGTLMIMSGFFLNIAVCGALFRMPDRVDGLDPNGLKYSSRSSSDETISDSVVVFKKDDKDDKQSSKTEKMTSRALTDIARKSHKYDSKSGNVHMSLKSVKIDSMLKITKQDKSIKSNTKTGVPKITVTSNHPLRVATPTAELNAIEPGMKPKIFYRKKSIKLSDEPTKPTNIEMKLKQEKEQNQPTTSDAKTLEKTDSLCSYRCKKLMTVRNRCSFIVDVDEKRSIYTSLRSNDSFGSQGFVNFYDFSIFKNVSFLFFLMQSMFLSFVSENPLAFLYKLTEKHGILSDYSNLLVSILGIWSMIGQLALGSIGDMNCMKTMVLYSIALAIAGSSNIFVSYVEDFLFFCIYASIYGFFCTANYALSTVIFIEMVGIEKLVHAYGISSMLEGLMIFIGMPITGVINDYHSPELTFLFSGIMICSASIFFFMLPCLENTVGLLCLKDKNPRWWVSELSTVEYETLLVKKASSKVVKPTKLV